MPSKPYPTTKASARKPSSWHWLTCRRSTRVEEKRMGNADRDFDKAVVVDGVRKTFGEVVALHEVSFEVNRGEVIGLLGPNGAGKTTIVDILSTLSRPDRGRAAVAGFDCVAEPAGVRRSIMLTGQQVAIDDMLTGHENLGR